jgi:hypothetical protein
LATIQEGGPFFCDRGSSGAELILVRLNHDVQENSWYFENRSPKARCGHLPVTALWRGRTGDRASKSKQVSIEAYQKTFVIAVVVLPRGSIFTEETFCGVSWDACSMLDLLVISIL